MRTFIIAEAGINHNANYDIALKLIDNAKLCGANAIKFQTAIPEEVMIKSAKQSPYQSKNFKSSNQLEMAKKLHFNHEIFLDLNKYCNKRNIEFISSPFDTLSMDYLLKKIKPKKMKIPSGEILNVPLLRKLKGYKGDVIISTGMSTINDIKFCMNVLQDIGINKKKISILHCHTDYPTKSSDANILAIKHIEKTFKTRVGYSDHTLGINASIIAVALGATIIEKHFTIDKSLPGPDQSSSLNISEFRTMVEAIRDVESLIGSGIKKPTKSELLNEAQVKKSIVAVKDINKGEKLTIKNITTKRPMGGVSSKEWDSIIDSKSKYNYKKDDFIKK